MEKRRIPPVRLLRLDRAMRGGGHPNAPSLARDLCVSVRTIQRDIEYLRDRGAPIRWNATRQGYEYTDPAYVPPVDARLTEGELLAVLTADRTLSEHRGTPYEAILRRIFLKAGRALAAPLRLKVADLVARVPGASPAPATFSEDLPRPGPSLSEDGPTRVTLRFAPRAAPALLALLWPARCQLQTQMDGGIQLALSTDNLDETLLWILQWGSDAEVVSPRGARRRLLRLLREIRSRYKKEPVRSRRPNAHPRKARNRDPAPRTG
jgi:predicted DNA-binding transcriptional regulator YafY